MAVDMETDIDCLILGYLKDHDFNRTAREFEIETRYSKRGLMRSQVIGKEYLMPSLSQIIHDYCAMKKVERELEKRNKPSCIVSLWKQFDALINQLRLLTIGKQTNQSGRKPSYRSVANAYYTRVSAQVTTPNLDNGLSQALQSYPAGTSSDSPSCRESELNGPSSQELKSKSQGVAKESEGNASSFDISQGTEQASSGKSTCVENALINHDREPADDPFHSRNEIAREEIVKNESLRSPRRKRIRPKKLENIVHSSPNLEHQNVNDQIQRMDTGIMTQQASNHTHTNSTASELNAIFDALLTSKSLQEKIADNINKVATSTQFHVDTGAQEAESGNALSTVDIEEILNITRSDPTFDSLFATLDDIEINPSSAQIQMASSESNVIKSTDANCEPPRHSAIVSEHIEELNSHGDCFTDSREMNDLEPFSVIEDCVIAAPIDQKDRKRNSHLAKQPPATIPCFTSTGFQPLQSYPVCNVYIKKKSNLKSGTWRFPAGLTNSAILTGSGSMSRARLNQTFKDSSRYKASDEKESSCKGVRSIKGNDARGTHGGSKMKSSYRIQSGSKDNELIMDHCSNENSAVLIGGDRGMGKKNSWELEIRSRASTTKCTVGKVKECSSGCEELGDSVETSARNGHRSYDNHLTSDVGVSHSNGSDHSADCIAKPESQGTARQHSSFSIDNRVGGDSGKNTERNYSSILRTRPSRHQRNRSSSVDTSDLEKEIHSIRTDSDRVQLSGFQFENNLSKEGALGCVDQNHYKRNKLTVRFDLPYEVEDAHPEGQYEVESDLHQKRLCSRGGESASLVTTVQGSLPKKSILKAGSADRTKLQDKGNSRICESSLQCEELGLGGNGESGEVHGCEGGRSSMQSADAAIAFGATELTNEKVSDKFLSANSCKNTEDSINLKCAEKIHFQENGNLSAMGFKEIGPTITTVIDNRVEYTIEDIKCSKNKAGAKRSKKPNTVNKRQRKENLNRVSNNNGTPANENVLEETKELNCNFLDNSKAVKSIDDTVEGSSLDRMVNGGGKNIHGKSDNASLLASDSQGESVEVDIVFETTTNGNETLTSVSSPDNSKIELENINDCEGKVIDEKGFFLHSRQMGANSMDFHDSVHCQNPVQPALNNKQHVQSTESNIFDKTYQEIHRLPQRALVDIPRLTEHDEMPTENVVLSLNANTESCRSDQEDCHNHAVKADRSSDCRIAYLSPVQMNEHFQNVRGDVVASNSVNGLIDENTSAQQPQNNTNRPDAGFEIMSSEVLSEPHVDFTSGRKIVEDEPSKPDIFAIYLSDDSNDSTTISQAPSQLPTARRNQTEGNYVRHEVAMGRDQVAGSVDGNLGPGAAVVPEGNNITESYLRKYTPEFIDSTVNNMSYGIGVNAKDCSDDCLSETRRNLEGCSSEIISSYPRNNPAVKEAGKHVLAGVGNKVQTKQADQKSTVVSRSKKRKTGQEEVCQPAKKQDKAQNSLQNVEVPKNLNIEEFLSRLKYT